MGLRNAVLGVPKRTCGGRGDVMNTVPGAFGGAPYAARKRCTGRAEKGHAVGGETL